MSNFDKYIESILKFEGGYVNDPVDAGGETKYGISKRAYPHLDIFDLTKEQAKSIYYRDYWLKAKCHYLPDNLQLIHFDTAVNSGIKRANKILQKAIGTVRVDGVIGQKTISASVNCSLADYVAERALFYAKIVKRKPSQVRFIVGWMNRLKKITNIF